RTMPRPHRRAPRLDRFDTGTDTGRRAARSRRRRRPNGGTHGAGWRIAYAPRSTERGHHHVHDVPVWRLPRDQSVPGRPRGGVRRGRHRARRDRRRVRHAGQRRPPQRPHVGVRRERRQPLALLAFEGGRVLGALRRRRAHDARHRGRGSDRRRPGSAGDRRRGHGTRGCLTAWSDEGGSGPRGSLPAMTATGATEKRIDATTELPAESGANGKAEQVRSMFSDIAPTYDLLNTVLSFGIDARWRAQAAREALPPDLLVAAGEAGAGSDRAVLDVATGTG